MKQKTIKKILAAVDVSEKQIDLVDKILSLEKDKEKIYSIDLFYGTISYAGLSVEVLLNEDFKGMENFREYLTNHDLPTEITSRKGSVYTLRNEEVLAKFLKPDIYPPKK